jgi:hypothetical protein
MCKLEMLNSGGLKCNHPVCTYLDFATITFLHGKVVSLASNPQPGEPGLCICPPVAGWPIYTPPPQQQAPFYLPSYTRGATVEIF